MKKYFITVSVIAIAAMAGAQVKQGTIIYERKVDVHRHMEDEQMKAMVPQFQVTQHELVFGDNISVYKTLPEDSAPDPFNNGGGNQIMIHIGGPGENGVLYKNFSNQEFFEQTDLGDDKYIIDDTIHTQPWKLTDETKTILNHTCKKAIMVRDSTMQITAWYAEDIPVPVGPENFGGLPGAILLIDADNGGMVYTAQEIKNDTDKKELKEPKDGKHITRAGFQEKMDEMFGAPGPDGSRRVIRNIN